MKIYVYILANKSRSVLYIGVTSNLSDRLEQHVNNTDTKAFTKRYNVHDLIYFEEFSCVEEAIAREKQLKGWTRKKKDALISASNPNLETLETPQLAL